MKKDELLGRLNERATELGLSPIKGRSLEAWAYEDMILGPDRVPGSEITDWDWPDESLVQAMEVLELRRRGFRRNAGVRAQQWIEGKDVSFVSVRGDLICEYDRARKLLLRYVSSTHGFGGDNSITGYSHRALLKQLGQLDPRFAAAGFDLGPAFWLAVYEIIRFGEPITPLPADTPPLARFLVEFRCVSGRHPIAGALNPEHEVGPSALRILRNLDPTTATACRNATLASLTGLEMLQAIMSICPEGIMPTNFQNAASAATNVIPRWPWAIFTFGLTANLLHNCDRDQLT